MEVKRNWQDPKLVIFGTVEDLTRQLPLHKTTGLADGLVLDENDDPIDLKDLPS